jgi:hypothetical protein
MAAIDIGKSVGVALGTGVAVEAGVSVGVGETTLTCGRGSGAVVGVDGVAAGVHPPRKKAKIQSPKIVLQHILLCWELSPQGSRKVIFRMRTSFSARPESSGKITAYQAGNAQSCRSQK